MKIVEFAGVPGCGKSTLCQQILPELKKKYKVFVYQDVVRFVSFPKRCALYRFLFGCNPFNWRYLSLLKRYTSQYPDASKQAICVLLALYGIPPWLSMLSPNSIFLLDEGFVQTLTSIPHSHTIQDTAALSDLCEYINRHRNICVIPCLAEDTLTIQRLRHRQRKDRFNMIKDDEELKRALQRKQENLSAVEQLFSTTQTVEMVDDPAAMEETARSLVQQILTSK